MTKTRIKKVITKKGKELYYLGDGIWFGRVSKKVAEQNLEAGIWSLWETVDKRNNEIPESTFLKLKTSSLAIN